MIEQDLEMVEAIFRPNARDKRNEIRTLGEGRRAGMAEKAWRDPNPKPQPEPQDLPRIGPMATIGATQRTPEEEAAYQEKRERIARDAEPDDYPDVP